VESGSTETPVGWVYRAEDSHPPTPVAYVPPAASAQRSPEEPRPEHPQVHQAETRPSSENPFLMVGKGFFLIGLGTVEFMSRTAVQMMVAPIRFARWMMISE
jgi:hypothetical protein